MSESNSQSSSSNNTSLFGNLSAYMGIGYVNPAAKGSTVVNVNKSLVTDDELIKMFQEEDDGVEIKKSDLAARMVELFGGATKAIVIALMTTKISRGTKVGMKGADGKMMDLPMERVLMEMKNARINSRMVGSKYGPALAKSGKVVAKMTKHSSLYQYMMSKGGIKDDANGIFAKCCIHGMIDPDIINLQYMWDALTAIFKVEGFSENIIDYWLSKCVRAIAPWLKSGQSLKVDQSVINKGKVKKALQERYAYYIYHNRGKTYMDQKVINWLKQYNIHLAFTPENLKTDNEAVAILAAIQKQNDEANANKGSSKNASV